MSDQKNTRNRLIHAVILGILTWGVLIGISMVLESILNRPAPRGLQSMGPIPVFFISALFLGWIPALIVGIKKFRRK